MTFLDLNIVNNSAIYRKAWQRSDRKIPSPCSSLRFSTRYQANFLAPLPYGRKARVIRLFTICCYQDFHEPDACAKRFPLAIILRIVGRNSASADCEALLDH